MKKLVLLGGGYGNMRVLFRLLPNNLPVRYRNYFNRSYTFP